MNEPKPELVTLREVCRMTSLTRTTINYRRAIGEFPQAVRLGDQRIAFVRSEVENWIHERIMARKTEAA